MKKRFVCMVILTLSLLMTACGISGQSGPQVGKVTTEQLQTSSSVIQTATAQQLTNLSGKSTTTAVGKTPGKQNTIGYGSISTTYPTPWGPPAIIKATLPSIIPCVVEYNVLCNWTYSASFESQNGIGGIIERVRRVYINKNGVRYTYMGSNGWDDYHIIVNPSGISKFDAWWSQRFNEIPDIRNGKVEITYEGHDNNGNPFRGTISTKLASN